MEEAKEVRPFSLQEAHFGREAAHQAYSLYCTRLSDENLITLCQIATSALEKVHAGAQLGPAVIQALKNAGIKDRSEEGRVRQQLYVKAVSAMFLARKEAKKTASKPGAAKTAHAQTSTSKEDNRAKQLSIKF